MWMLNSLAPQAGWHSIISDSSGSYLAAGQYPGDIYILIFRWLVLFLLIISVMILFNNLSNDLVNNLSACRKLEIGIIECLRTESGCLSVEWFYWIHIYLI